MQKLETARVAELAAELREQNGGRHVTTVTGAGRLLGTSDATIRRAVWAGEIPAARLGGKRGRLSIRIADLARYLAAREAVALAPAPVRRRAARNVETSG